jgi:hypothetical protein
MPMQAKSWCLQQTPRSSQTQCGNVHMSVLAETNQQAHPETIRAQAVEKRRAVRRWKVCVSHIAGYRTHFVVDFVTFKYFNNYATLFLCCFILLGQSLSTGVGVSQPVSVSLNPVSVSVNWCQESLNWCQCLSIGVRFSQLVSESLNWFRRLSTGVRVSQFVLVSLSWC